MNYNIVYFEDCRATTKNIPGNSIDLVITSPPYFVNKKYERNINYKEYCDLISTILKEINRILLPGKYAVINFGDYFNSNDRFYQSDVPSCYPATINYFKWGVEEAGMDLQATRIWRKKFCKMGIPFVCNKHPRPIFDYEHIWTFRKKNGSKEEFVNNRKLSQRGVLGEDWNNSAGLKNHCASFPIDFPLWAIKVYSENEQEVIYDPFMGSGTVALACLKSNRKFIGSENDEKYYKDCIINIRNYINQLKSSIFNL
jgi:modification methylase